MKPRFHSPSEAIDALVEELNQEARNQLKLLLETKHLYQKVTINAEQIIRENRDRISESRDIALQTNISFNRIIGDPFMPTNEPLHFESKYHGSISSLQLV
jgi:hypothetical protein